MGKRADITELTNLLSNSLVHKIGAIVNKKEPYSDKYMGESENFLEIAKDVSRSKNWNNYDKIEIKNQLRKKLLNELTKREFLDSRKFDFVDKEIKAVLEELGLDVK